MSKAQKFSNEMVTTFKADVVYQSANSIAQALPLSAVKTIDDAITFIQATDILTGKALFARAKAFELIKEKELYKDKGYKDIYGWANKLYGFSRSKVDESLRVAKFVDSTTYESILPHKTKYDFTYSQILFAYNADSNNEKDPEKRIQHIISLAEQGIITPSMSAKEIKKALIFKDDITEQADFFDTTTEKVESTENDEKTESTESTEKTESKEKADSIDRIKMGMLTECSKQIAKYLSKAENVQTIATAKKYRINVVITIE